MLESLKQADLLVQGGFVAAIGLAGVFLVLVLFFVVIRLLQRLDRKSQGKSDQD
jgi:Na+-transporting methylmalonyl-CoA/oxaloacetate decarboxylase gamma subunit